MSYLPACKLGYILPMGNLCCLALHAIFNCEAQQIFHKGDCVMAPYISMTFYCNSDQPHILTSHIDIVFSKCKIAAFASLSLASSQSFSSPSLQILYNIMKLYFVASFFKLRFLCLLAVRRASARQAALPYLVCNTLDPDSERCLIILETTA
jgi:hypothetical protein